MKPQRARRTDAARDLSTPIEEPYELLTALVASRYPTDHPSYRAVHEAARSWVPIKKLKKLSKLLEWHSIDPRDPNCWLYLSVRLAEELHEGFRVGPPKTRGRPTGTGKVDGFELFKAVQVEISVDGCDIVEACRRLSKAKSGKWRKQRINSLATRYHEYKKSLANRKNAENPTGFLAFLIDAARSAEVSFSTTTNP